MTTTNSIVSACLFKISIRQLIRWKKFNPSNLLLTTKGSSIFDDAATLVLFYEREVKRIKGVNFRLFLELAIEIAIDVEQLLAVVVRNLP